VYTHSDYISLKKKRLDKTFKNIRIPLKLTSKKRYHWRFIHLNNKSSLSYFSLLFLSFFLISFLLLESIKTNIHTFFPQQARCLIWFLDVVAFNMDPRELFKKKLLFYFVASNLVMCASR